MQILHVIHTLNPEAGGPIEAVRTLFSYGDRGYLGEVVTLDPPEASYLRDVPVAVHALGRGIGGYGLNLRLLTWIRRNAHRFDGVIINGLWQFCGVATLLALPSSVPYMVFPHGMLDPYFKNAFPAKHLKKLIYWTLCEYWVLKRAHRVLFTTRTEADLARTSFHYWSWTEQIVPYGIRPPSISPEEAYNALFSSAEGLEGKPYILFLGRVHPKKGCDLLLRAFAKIVAEDPNIYLTVAGPVDAKYLEELSEIVNEENIQSKIFWLGPVYGAVKWGVLAHAGAFILPSHQENFGISVAEALAMGTPVLLSDKVNIGDVIRDDGCLFIDHDSVEGTYRLIRKWLDLSIDEQDAMRQRAVQSFSRRFDMSKTAELILKLFENTPKKGPVHAS